MHYMVAMVTGFLEKNMMYRFYDVSFMSVVNFTLIRICKTSLGKMKTISSLLKGASKNKNIDMLHLQAGK